MGRLRRWAIPLKANVREWLDANERRVHARRCAFYAQMVGKSDLCFDIGANTGNRVKVFRSLGAAVVAVEPQPQLASYLRARFPTRTNVVEAGVGSTPGTATLHLASSHTVASMSESFVEKASEGRWFGDDVRWTREVVVPVVTLDELIEEHGNPRFIKIDVEGFELEALLGLSSPVPWISFEFVAWMADQAEACMRRVEALGEYEFSYSAGESFEWLLPRFTAAGEVLTAAREAAPSGDVYARLR